MRRRRRKPKRGHAVARTATGPLLGRQGSIADPLEVSARDVFSSATDFPTDDVSASIIVRPLGCPHHQDLYSAELRAFESRVQAVPQQETSWAADPVIAGQPLADRQPDQAGEFRRSSGAPLLTHPGRRQWRKTVPDRQSENARMANA
jgi:hypothetical protein